VPDDPESYLTLRQADQARTDFAIIETELEAIHARLARLPTWADLARATQLIAFVAAVLGIVGIKPFWYYRGADPRRGTADRRQKQPLRSRVKSSNAGSSLTRGGK
jgi:hypothetical protein